MNYEIGLAMKVKEITFSTAISKFPVKENAELVYEYQKTCIRILIRKQMTDHI